MVSSRGIKSLYSSPGGILFRTHNYDFHVQLDDEFYEQVGKRHSFMLRIKLFKKCEFPTLSWDEYRDSKGRPIIKVSSMEDVQRRVLRASITYGHRTNHVTHFPRWPIKTECTWKGKFRLELEVFAKVSVDQYKMIVSMHSSSFSIQSKPDVYLKRKLYVSLIITVRQN